MQFGFISTIGKIHKFASHGDSVDSSVLLSCRCGRYANLCFASALILYYRYVFMTLLS